MIISIDHLVLIIKQTVSHLHPAVFAVLVPLSIYLNNQDQLRLADVIATCGLAIGISAVIFSVLLFLSRNINKSAVLTSVLALLLFSFGQVRLVLRTSLSKTGPNNLPNLLVDSLAARTVWVMIWILFLTVVVYLTIKSKSKFSVFNSAMNAIAATALIFSVGQFLLQSDTNASKRDVESFIDHWIGAENQVEGEQSPGNSFSRKSPDIYYIILDGYARSDVLLERYQVDNRNLIESLQDLGFYVAQNSYANYAWTELSISSSLNFTYLDAIQEKYGPEYRDTYPLQMMVEQNRLAQFVKQFGYQLVAFEDEYWITNIGSADRYMTSHLWNINAFQLEIYNSTPLPVISDIFSLKNPYDSHRERVNFILDQLPDLPKESGPKLVFAHILAPHPPFVFTADGSSVEPDYEYSMVDGSAFLQRASAEEYYFGYREQAQYLSNRLQEVVARILESSAEPPIILIQSDHGPGLGLDWYSLEETDVWERFAILNAYYFPEQDYADLYQDISPVNSFRVILNQFFSTDLPILGDRFFYTTEDRPFDFFEIDPKP